MTVELAIKAALRNISLHGDTDIFPFPFENLAFGDHLLDATAVLETINRSFDDWLSSYPPQTISSLTQVGYTGFRWAALIDPFWNAYYLGLVISIADQIEAQRIRESDEAVFSYRFAWQEPSAKLFKDTTWVDFRKKCLTLSNRYPVIVQTDIADFYPRIYHHRIENALNRLPDAFDTPKRIMALLKAFSKNVSYGLPIGGPGSRILAELALNGTDTLLVRKGVVFCRYADDYAIFCSDKADAYRTLVFLSEKLANEGLALQKKKTRILTAEEFQHTAQILDPAEITDKLASEDPPHPQQPCLCDAPLTALKLSEARVEPRPPKIVMRYVSGSCPEAD
jgi:reverse transcriptase-like protein